MQWAWGEDSAERFSSWNTWNFWPGLHIFDQSFKFNWFLLDTRTIGLAHTYSTQISTWIYLNLFYAHRTSKWMNKQAPICIIWKYFSIRLMNRAIEGFLSNIARIEMHPIWFHWCNILYFEIHLVAIKIATCIVEMTTTLNTAWVVYDKHARTHIHTHTHTGIQIA